MHVVLEELATFTPLGIRFWDPVLDSQVREGLRVRARAPGGARTAEAFRTLSDVYAFHGLPGLRALEHAPAPATDASPPERHRFVVEVSDLHRRYLDVAFTLDLPLPYRGLFPLGAAASPIEPPPRGFHLHSAPTRAVPPWLAALRADLVDLEREMPAAYAVLRVELPGGGRFEGIADGGGRVLVLMPVPLIEGGRGVSPLALADRRPLAARSFEVTVSVRLARAPLAALPGATLPELRDVLGQPAGLIWPQAPEEGGQGAAALAAELPLRRELVLRSAPGSTLLVSAQPASP